MFSEQHYSAVAKIIKDARREARMHPIGAEQNARLEQLEALELAFIDRFEADNPRFNKLLFIGACGEISEAPRSDR